MHNGNKSKGKTTEEIFEMMSKNFPKLLSDTKPQIQKTQKNTKQHTCQKNCM